MHAVAHLLGGGDGLRRMRQIKKIGHEKGAGLSARRLHLVEAEIGAVVVREPAETLEKLLLRHAMTARALDRLDDDADDLAGVLAQAALDALQRLLAAKAIFRVRVVVVHGRERHLDVAVHDAVKILRDDRAVREIRDVQREDGAAVKRLVKIEKALRPRERLAVLLLMQGDEVLHHVLDRLGARVHGVDLELVAAHAARRDLVQRAVVGDAFRREEIDVRHLVVGGVAQAAQVIRLEQSRMIVRDPLRGVVAGPVKKPLPVDRRQPHALARREIDDVRIRIGDDVAPQFRQSARRSSVPEILLPFMKEAHRAQNANRRAVSRRARASGI